MILYERRTYEPNCYLDLHTYNKYCIPEDILGFESL